MCIKKENLPFLHTISRHQPQNNKFPTQQEKLNPKGQYINITFYKFQSTFAYTISFLFKTNKQKKTPKQILTTEEETEAQKVYCLYLAHQ